MELSITGAYSGWLKVRIPASPALARIVESLPGSLHDEQDPSWLVPSLQSIVDRLLDALHGSGMFSFSETVPEKKPDHAELLMRYRDRLRAAHYSRRTEQAYFRWAQLFLERCREKRPTDNVEARLNSFLTDLAVKQKISASTQNQALAALLFLYRHVLEYEIKDLGQIVRAKEAVRLPVFLSRQ